MQAECAEAVEACKAAKAAAAAAQRDAGQAAAQQQRARTASAAMHTVVRALQDNVRSPSRPLLLPVSPSVSATIAGSAEQCWIIGPDLM